MISRVSLQLLSVTLDFEKDHKDFFKYHLSFSYTKYFWLAPIQNFADISKTQQLMLKSKLVNVLHMYMYLSPVSKLKYTHAIK